MRYFDRQGPRRHLDDVKAAGRLVSIFGVGVLLLFAIAVFTSCDRSQPLTLDRSQPLTLEQYVEQVCTEPPGAQEDPRTVGEYLATLDLGRQHFDVKPPEEIQDYHNLSIDLMTAWRNHLGQYSPEQDLVEVLLEAGGTAEIWTLQQEWTEAARNVSDETAAALYAADCFPSRAALEANARGRG